ncbi:hypothetical protein ET495_10240 [Xylanimonas allomyrinae]|uniref:Uncharacterized protein n=1 Tax=Xylanimonas allomyrinae TaxID=2509459 RepID=A0A4P6ELL1_9MICO|nr:hypothetical protein [Xylanimonas allomyrinae]QAY63564.1 hypothetical protein ET495_10240 [Xylanimonas allomyrinae]
MTDGWRDPETVAGPGAASPPGDASPRRRHRRVVRAGNEREQVPGVSDDERGGHGDNDQRLLGDVPPHWGRR